MTKYHSLFSFRVDSMDCAEVSSTATSEKTTPTSSKIARCPWGWKWGLKMGIRCAVQISSVCVPPRHVHHLHTCLAGPAKSYLRTDPPRHTSTHQISTHFYVTRAFLRNERWIVCRFIIRNIQLELFRMLRQASPNISGDMHVKLRAYQKRQHFRASWKCVKVYTKNFFSQAINNVMMV